MSVMDVSPLMVWPWVEGRPPHRMSAGDLADWLEDRDRAHVRGAPYHPQTQGKSERWHQTLKHRILLGKRLSAGCARGRHRGLRRALQSPALPPEPESPPPPPTSILDAARPSYRRDKGPNGRPLNTAACSIAAAPPKIINQIRPTLRPSARAFSRRPSVFGHKSAPADDRLAESSADLNFSFGVINRGMAVKICPSHDLSTSLKSASSRWGNSLTASTIRISCAFENLDTDLRPPQSAIDFTKQAVDNDDANSYLPFFGLDPMRQAAAMLVGQQSGQQYDWKTECIISAGGLSRILNVLLATIEPGDEVLMTDPIYVGLINRVRLAGGVPPLCVVGPI